mmetsp:Transcript_44565/g.140613  ORF Transcript_44565/g.140613 Transcript_44565/m.140613 type:complete len:291 (-) Transcript_44565:473-1345(-)
MPGEHNIHRVAVQDLLCPALHQLGLSFPLVVPVAVVEGRVHPDNHERRLPPVNRLEILLQPLPLHIRGDVMHRSPSVVGVQADKVDEAQLKAVKACSSLVQDVVAPCWPRPLRQLAGHSESVTIRCEGLCRLRVELDLVIARKDHEWQTCGRWLHHPPPRVPSVPVAVSIRKVSDDPAHGVGILRCSQAAFHLLHGMLAVNGLPEVADDDYLHYLGSSKLSAGGLSWSRRSPETKDRVSILVVPCCNGLALLDANLIVVELGGAELSYDDMMDGGRDVELGGRRVEWASR